MTLARRTVRPASATWSNQETVRHVGHRAYFEEFGFTVVRGLLEPPQVCEAAAEVERIVASREQLSNVRVIGTRDPLGPSYDLEDHADEGTGMGPIRKITGLRVLSPTLARHLVECPALIDLLHELMGDRVELYRDALMLKSARVGQEKPWHQDAVYWPFRPMQLVSAMIALDSATAANGCLQVVPKSHTNIFAHQKVNAELQLDVGRLGRQAVYVELAPGDCLVFHSLLLHASEHNFSDRDRRVSICSYSPGNLQSLNPNIVPPILLSERRH